MQDSTFDLPAVLLSLFLNSMSSRTTFRLAAFPALPPPEHLLPQKFHWLTFPICPALEAWSKEYLTQSLKSDGTIYLPFTLYSLPFVYIISNPYNSSSL